MTSPNMQEAIDLLKSYRCQHTVDDEGNGQHLVDVLSPGETIKEGEEEIELLADEIALAIDKHDKESEARGRLAGLEEGSADLKHQNYKLRELLFSIIGAAESADTEAIDRLSKIARETYGNPRV